MYQIVYGNAIGYITQTACQPVCVDVAMTAALAAQAEAVKQQVAQAQAAAAALAAQQAALAQQAAMQQAAVQQATVQQAALAQAQAERKAPFRRAAATSSSSGTPRRDRWRMQSVERQHGLVRPLWHAFGGGVDWLSTAQAKKDVDQYMTPGSVIILNYGVNDLSRHNDYITTIKRYAQDWISKRCDGVLRLGRSGRGKKRIRKTQLGGRIF